jgi:hypothetical protein
MAKTPAWQRKEGKNPEGGLNAKGRASYNKANPSTRRRSSPRQLLCPDERDEEEADQRQDGQ